MINIPQDDLSEKNLLSCLIFQTNLYKKIKGDIDQSYFHSDKNRDLFIVIDKLYTDGITEIDYTTLARELKKIKSIASIEYMIAIQENVSPSQFMVYYKNVTEFREKRETLRIAYKAIKDINEGKDAEEVQNELKGGISEEISTLDYSYHDHISEMANNSSIKFRDISKRVYATGFDFIDSPIYSLMPAETFFIAAEGGLGKSTLCKEIAVYMARNGVACVFETLEQTKESMYTSIINSEAAKSRPNHSFLALTEMIKDNKDVSAEYYKAQTMENIFLFDKSTTYLSDIRKHVRIVKKQRQKPVCLFLDSFSQLNIAGQFKSETERENAISKEITQLAKDENIPIIIIHHNNKEGKFRGSEKLKDNAWWWISLSPINGETNSDYINPKWVKTREFRGSFKEVLFEKVDGYIKEIDDQRTIAGALESEKKQRKPFS